MGERGRETVSVCGHCTGIIAIPKRDIQKTTHAHTYTHITHKHRQMRSRARTHNTQYAMENSFQLKSVPNEDINEMNFGLFCYLSYFSSSSGFLLRRRKQQQQQQWNDILLCVCFVTARVHHTQCTHRIIHATAA